MTGIGLDAACRGSVKGGDGGDGGDGDEESRSMGVGDGAAWEGSESAAGGIMVHSSSSRGLSGAYTSKKDGALRS